jgi:hypothetical protein
MTGALGVQRLSLRELCKGNLKGDFITGDPGRYVEKALEKGISFHRGPVWETWRRAHLPRTLRDEGGTVAEASLSEEAPWRGPQAGSSFTRDPERYVKKVSGYGRLSPWEPLSI